MTREDLITKWLDNNLNSEELEAFKALDDYNELIRLDTAIQHFKSPDFNETLELEKLNYKLKSKTQKQTHWLKPILSIAAILVLCFSLFYYTTTLNTSVNTQIAQKETITLPDASLVMLNAMSSIDYNDSNWDDNRNIKLNGEAYFKVAKGEKFTVNTTSGSISVLGTEFNVKNRVGFFEVICYEGSVLVENKLRSKILKPGDRFLVLNNNFVDNLTVIEDKPFWTNNESAFKSIPFKQVLLEFERQYNVSFNVNNIDTNQLFTGSFAHNDMEIALKAITLPLSLTYYKNNDKISLKRE